MERSGRQHNGHAVAGTEAEPRCTSQRRTEGTQWRRQVVSGSSWMSKQATHWDDSRRQPSLDP